ncbi:MAG: signal peptidase I [Clostridia bacterium]|nr:signal peptidase I [Clostridia bacterium]
MSDDNFNKKPDNQINKDEELTAILQRLSVLLDKSVSLDDAIELAKQQPTVDLEDKYTDTEIPQETDEVPNEEQEQTEETVISDSQDNLEEAIVALSEETEEETETEEGTTIESEKSEVNETEKSMPVSDFVKLLKSKRFTEQAEKEEAPEAVGEDTQTEEALTVEDIAIQEQETTTEDNSVVVEEFSTEDRVFDDENEIIIEKKPLLEVNTKQQETTKEPLATSKIFDELLACFDDHKLPDNFRFNDSPTEITDEVKAEANEEPIDDNAVSAQEIENEEAPPPFEFMPIEHENTEEDELFSKIFSEEKSERKNREKDKKKWQSQSDESSSFLAGLYDWLEVIVLSAAFALLLFTFILRLAIVDGNSMNHTLHDKEMLIISDFMYTPENNDIIVFTSPNYPEPIVKRIIATAGQTVDIDFDTWTVTVDGKVIKEDYINRVAGIMKSSDVAFPLTVPEGYVFVMGDNRNDSLDSRNSLIGFVDERYILGEVKIRIFPLDRFGTVD